MSLKLNTLKSENNTTWHDFIVDLQADIKLFVYLLVLLSAMRMTFIIWMRGYISDDVVQLDFVESLLRGGRMDIKTAGWGLFFSFTLCTLPRFFSGGLVPRHLRLFLGSVFTMLIVFLSMASIPYYQQFRMVFSPLVFNVTNEDNYAVFMMLLQQYGLLWRGLIIGGISLLAMAVLYFWLRRGYMRWPQLSSARDLALRLALFIAIFYFSIMLIYGGVLSYAYDIDWENCGTTSDKLLNEAALGGVYGLYRAYDLKERMKYCGLYNLASGDINEYGAVFLGRPLISNYWRDYVRKQTMGAVLPKPKKIVLVIAESYYNWVLQPQYATLKIADGMKAIINRADSAYVSDFLPNGMATIYAVTGVATGLPDANLYVNYMNESYKGPYETSIAPQMERLGYKTAFWYGGPGSWERIQEFVTSQGYDKFYGLAAIGGSSEVSNAWGVNDKILTDAVLHSMDNDEQEFYTVLTVSNHPPFNSDIEAAGVDISEIAKGAPSGVDSDWNILWELGHFYYADRILANFISRVRTKFPDSLVIVVGDHADRLNLEKNPSTYERYGVPFILCGQGVSNNLFSEGATGSHIDIAATIIELIAPANFTYYSLGRSLTFDNDIAFNYGFWTNGNFIGTTGDYQKYENIPGRPAWPLPDTIEIKKRVDAVRALAWWRIQKGELINNEQ